MIRAIIIDDEELGIRTLNRQMQEFSHTIEIIATYTDPLQGLIESIAQQPDVVFLDIEMPMLNGFEVAKQLAAKNQNITIVFVTAFDDYAVKAFELNSLDYLLKPVSKDRLEQTLQKISRQKRTMNAEKIEAAGKAVKARVSKVIVNENDRLIVIDPSDIYYFTAEGNGVTIITEGRAYAGKENLTYWTEKMTDFDFYRCHKSFLVNLQKISEIHTLFNNTYDIKFASLPQTIPVSRRYASELKAILEL